MNYKEVKNSIEKMPPKTLIIARSLYLEKFSTLSFATFLKYLERLPVKNYLKKIGKGVYCRAVSTPFGIMGVSTKDIENHFISDNKDGMLIGYKLYTKYNLTTQIAKTAEVYSRIATHNVQTIGSVKVKKLEYRKAILFQLEIFEILENYRIIQELDKVNLYKFCTSIAKSYNERKTLEAYRLGKYKKRTLAFLKHILDYFSVPNNLGLLLNGLSKYAHLQMEDLYHGI